MKYGAIGPGPEVYIWSGIAFGVYMPCYMFRCAATGAYQGSRAIHCPELTPRAIDGLEFT